MSTLRININFANNIIYSSSSSSLAFFGLNADSQTTSGSPSAVLGTTNTFGAGLYIYKGTAPNNFTEFSGISSRQSDLLMNIPVYLWSGSSSLLAPASGNSAARMLGAQAAPTTISVTRSLGTSAQGATRTNNNSTIVINSGTGTTHNLAVGQTVTVGGLTDTSFNGTFTVTGIANAFAFIVSNPGPNATSTATAGFNIQVPFTPFANGTATWFCLARTNNGFSANSAFNGGAVIGTVGTIGSNSDLELYDTNLVVGNYYNSAGLYLSLPTSFDVP